MKKLSIRLLAIVALIFLVFACEKKESKGLTDFSNPDYSSIDSLVMNAIYSVDRNIFYYENWNSERAAFLVPEAR